MKKRLITLTLFFFSIQVRAHEYLALIKPEFKTQFFVHNGLSGDPKKNVLSEIGVFKFQSQESLESLKSRPEFSAVEPNYRYKLTSPSAYKQKWPRWMNDPRLENSWWFNNYGQSDKMGQVGFVGADIGITQLWNRGVLGSRKILVGILDSGIDIYHEDLKNNIWKNSLEIENNGLDDDQNGFVDDVHGWNFVENNNNAQDLLGHGTHVAGIIGAEAGNALGVVGVSPQVSLVPIRVMDSEGYGTLENIVAGVYYASKIGVKVLNASLGGDPYSQIFYQAIEHLNQNKIIFVAAAGNDNQNNDLVPFYPAGYDLPNVIAVAASDNQDNKADFSHFGAKTVHIAAPGVLIWSTTPNNNYDAFSGTSMAAPMVTGGVALLMSSLTNLNPFEIKMRLLNGCDPAYALKRNTLCKGRMNLLNSYLNQKSPNSDPDEKLWQSARTSIQTEHPYLDADQKEFFVHHNNALFIRLHFKRIETEEFDKILIQDQFGKTIEVLAGEHKDYFSEPIPGDSAKILFKPDLSLPKWGFEIDSYQFIPNPHFNTR